MTWLCTIKIERSTCGTSMTGSRAPKCPTHGFPMTRVDPSDDIPPPLGTKA